MLFKCKMCGGDIESISPGIGKCKYCKSTMTLPNLDDEKKLNLYNRANSLRLKNEFDKAYEIYESILKIDNNEVEAHWGLILCKYGVEYVDDPRTKLKIPTCHRTIYESVLADPNFEFVKKNTHGEVLDMYTKEAKQISNIQKRILDISSKEEPYDIFICYKETDKNGERTKESVLAEEVYEKLTELNYKVFFARITLEDKIGEEYEPYIFNALTTAKVMLVFGTSVENLEAVWVKNEWSRYLELMSKDKSKTLVPVYCDMDAYELPVEFSMLQAQDMGKVGAIQDLIRGVKKLVNSSKNNTKLDDETFKKFQEVLDDSSKISEDKYEIVDVKEKLPIWYYASVVILILIVLSFKLTNFFTKSLTLFRYLSVAGISTTSYLEHSNSILPYIINIVEFITGALLIISGVCMLKSRKSYKTSKKILRSIILIEFVLMFVASLGHLVIKTPKIISLIIYIALVLINPKWKIDASSKLIVDKKRKIELERKNKLLKENFLEKEPSFIKKEKRTKTIIISILIIIIYVIISLVMYYLPKIMPMADKRDNSILQIKILEDKLVVKDKSNNKISYALKGEYYTVIGGKTSTKNIDCEYYLQIKSKQNLEGFVCAKKGDNYNVEILIPEYPNLSPSKKYVKITKEFVTIKQSTISDKYDEIAIKGQIYELIHEYPTYYKIRTENGIAWVTRYDAELLD